ncbi:hypothetical protein [Streptomyces subrutilus]|uniref:hypothetical protein n=1 Tax=Streptomyces subrutilus TaxID=36818 RepID=UPI0033FCB84A
MKAALDSFEHMPHPLLRMRVRDIASGTEGELMAVVREEVPQLLGGPTRVLIAYIRMASGRESTTALANVEAV